MINPLFLFIWLQGKVSLISQTGVHQLHIFLFVLAIFHVLYSVVTMALGQAKVSFNSIISSLYAFIYTYTTQCYSARLRTIIYLNN
jgi:hypothetical protein